MIRKVIRIQAQDSPNVKTGRILFPGVITREEYEKRRKTWDPVRQCIGLDAEFYKGGELLLYPPTWLNEAEQRHLKLRGVHRIAKAIGVDPAEGGDSTSIAVVDGKGLLDLESRKTPNTASIRGLVKAKMREWNVPPDKVLFDAGGGGKQITDQMREEGYGVDCLGFGNAPRLEPKYGLTLVVEREEVLEEKAAYVLVRDQMFWELRELIDPVAGDFAWAIPGEGEAYQELRRQMALIPLSYDQHGRVKIIPKDSPNADADTLKKRMGRSPDELDAVLLGVHRMLHKPVVMTAGAE